MDWWCKHTKTKIRTLFRQTGADRMRDFRRMDAFYHDALYDLVNAPIDHLRKNMDLNELKAKIIKLHATISIDDDGHWKHRQLRRGRAVLISPDTHDQTTEHRTIQQIRTSVTETTTTTNGILHAFYKYCEAKYDTLDVP
jgi:hypothetical protein